MNATLLWLLATLATVLGAALLAWGVGSIVTLSERGSLALWWWP